MCFTSIERYQFQDFKLTIMSPTLLCCYPMNNIQLEGTISQIFYFILCKKTGNIYYDLIFCVHVCECNVVNATLSQRYLESTFLCCDNVKSQPKNNFVTTRYCLLGFLFVGSWSSLTQAVTSQAGHTKLM